MNKVHNKYKNTAPKDAVYIGRGSKWGNPYVIGKWGNRDEVCDMYAEAILKSPERIAIIKAELKGKDLVCFCKPQRCHGDFLLNLANGE